MAALNIIAFMGVRIVMRLCFGMLSGVLLVVADKSGACGRSLGQQCFDTSLHPITAEIA